MSRNAAIVGIQVHWCDEDGKKHVDWVDLDKVEALSWYSDPVGAKVGNKPSSKVSIPTGPSHPLPCPKSGNQPEQTKESEMEALALTSNGAPICWWNGIDWVCGTM